jgi:hypothetical protein
MDNQEILLGHRYEPKIISYCECEEMRKQLESFQQKYNEHLIKWADYSKQLESLQQDKAALIEVLEWYGDEGIYSPTYELDEEAVEECWICTPAEMVADSGKRARTILSRMK